MIDMLVSFLCNYPSTGCFSGKFSAIDIERDGGSSIMHFDYAVISEEEITGPSIEIDRENRKVLIGHMKLHYTGYTSNFGNWCWDAFLMDEHNVSKLLNYLRKSKFWDMTEGEENLFDKWEKKLIIQEEDLKTQGD